MSRSDNTFIDLPEGAFPLCILAFNEGGAIEFSAIVAGPAAVRVPGLDERGGTLVTRVILVCANGSVVDTDTQDEGSDA